MDNRRLRILLVDDDEDDYVLTRDLLSEIENSAFEVEWRATYDAALEAIARREHDVCLIDYRLGDRDGLDLLRAAQRNSCTVPMILLTGQGDHHIDMEAMQAGAADYMIKGQLTAPLLERSIRYAVQHARIQAALRALLEVAKDCAGTLDVQSLIDRVQRRTAEFLPCDIVFTVTVDPRTDVAQVLSAYGVPPRLLVPMHGLRFPGSEDFGSRLRCGETLIINDMAAQPWLSPDLVCQFGITALLAVGLQMHGRYFGALVACNVAARRFQPHQIELFEGIARELAVATDAAELYRAQKQEAQVSSALARVGREIITSVGSPRFLNQLCQVTAEVLGGDASHTLLWHPDEDVYVPVAEYGATSEEREVARIVKVPRQMMAGLLAKLEHGDVGQVHTIPTHLLSRTEQQRLGLAANLCMALRRGTMVIGLQVVLARNRAEPFGEVHWRIAEGIAHVASIALEHARVVQALDQANRLKSEFVATMSHELRTPLNIIMGYGELLLGGEFGALNPGQVDILQRMDRNAHELFELVNATLNLGRFEAGQVTLTLEEVALADLLTEVCAHAPRVADKSNVKVVLNAAPDLPRLCTDTVKLKAILKNLLNNALKFTEKGLITVGAVQGGDGIVFSVADTGIGIAPDKLPIIFEPFRQGDGSMTRRYGGVGLGLYIVRRFVDVLGGTVTVETELGKGSTFRVRLPLRAVPDRVAA